jgi:hypothetical protein
MKDFQVPTGAIGVEMFLADGVHIKGRMFLAKDPHHPGQTDQLIGALNDAREFLPFEVGDDRGARSLVLNKEHIVRVRILQPDPEELEASFGDRTGGAGAPCETILHLSDGTQVAGRVAVDTPTAASRLVDKLNVGQRFIPVVRDDGVDLVQRTHVLTLD